MPAERRPRIRYETLHRYLSRPGSYWTADELRQLCGVAVRERLGPSDQPDPSLRTFKEDMKRLRAGVLNGRPAPVAFCRRRRAWHYTEAFEPYAGPLTRADYARLREALAVLEQVQGRAPLLDLEDTLFRLRRQLAEPEVDFSRFIRFEGTGIRRGREHLAGLYAHLRRREVLRLDYQPFGQAEPERFLFTPLLLQLYNRRWFLLGWHHGEARVETRPLDRIHSFAPVANRPAEPPPRFYESWLANVIGVTRLAHAELCEIVVRVDRAVAPYWETKPLHTTQTELRDRADATHRYFRLRLYPNYELESRLLGFGEAVEVLSPTSLRARLAERLRAAAARYEDQNP